MPSIDSATVSHLAGVEQGTLGVWIQRNLVANVIVGTRGRARSFTIDDAIHVCIMAALVRCGLSAPVASEVAQTQRDAEGYHQPNAVLVIDGAPGPGLTGGIPRVSYYAALAPLPLSEIIAAASDAFTVCKISQIADRVKAFVAAAEAET